jgi:hypothetical protein
MSMLYYIYNHEPNSLKLKVLFDFVFSDNWSYIDNNISIVDIEYKINALLL